MRPFSYHRAADVDDALRAGARGAAYYAGGTTLVDLMKLDVESPRGVVDINRLPLGGVELLADGTLRLGALARMSDVAADATVKRIAPALAESLAAAASGQLRNMATLGGNVLQRTRCMYFRDLASACNKREPGSGCDALGGESDGLAVLGTSEACIASNPSDFAVALAAFDATFRVRSAGGARTIPAASFWLMPGDTPERETALTPGDLIVAIDVAPVAAAARSTYVKIRERASYAFALVSCAAGVALGKDGAIEDARIALGGVGTIPWRTKAAEDALRGKRPEPAVFAAAAKAAFEDARPTPRNAYKVDLGMRALVRALETVTA